MEGVVDRFFLVFFAFKRDYVIRFVVDRAMCVCSGRGGGVLGVCLVGCRAFGRRFWRGEDTVVIDGRIRDCVSVWLEGAD